MERIGTYLDTYCKSGYNILVMEGVANFMEKLAIGL